MKAAGGLSAAPVVERGVEAVDDGQRALDRAQAPGRLPGRPRRIRLAQLCREPFVEHQHQRVRAGGGDPCLERDGAVAGKRCAPVVRRGRR
jgi:hypothetical protein